MYQMLKKSKSDQSAISEVGKCAAVCRYYADKAAEFLTDVLVETDANKIYVQEKHCRVIRAEVRNVPNY